MEKAVSDLKYEYADYAYLMKVLADETRLRILVMLTKGELCACKILEEFKITQPTLSHHMKTLKNSGLVKSRREGVWMKYTLDRRKLGFIEDFFGLLMKEEAVQGEDQSC
jgi:ArsR family transcriptional regulator